MPETEPQFCPTSTHLSTHPWQTPTYGHRPILMSPIDYFVLEPFRPLWLGYFKWKGIWLSQMVNIISHFPVHDGLIFVLIGWSRKQPHFHSRASVCPNSKGEGINVHKVNINIRNTEEAVWGSQYSSRLLYRPRPIWLHTVWWPRGVLWPEYCLWGVSYFYYPTILISVHYNAMVFISWQEGSIAPKILPTPNASLS